MKFFLPVLIAVTCAQSAFAFDGFGMDDSYNQSLMPQQAVNSSADSGSDGYGTSTSAWQDMDYVGKQYAPLGNVQALIYRTSNGAVSTFKGTSGDKINSAGLAKSSNGLMAVAGGYIQAACKTQGTSGFGPSLGSRVYPSLPACSTSTVNFNIAY